MDNGRTTVRQSFIMKLCQQFHPKMKTYRNVFRPIKCMFLKSTGVTVFRLAISTHFFLYVSFCICISDYIYIDSQLHRCTVHYIHGRQRLWPTYHNLSSPISETTLSWVTGPQMSPRAINLMTISAMKITAKTSHSTGYLAEGARKNNNKINQHVKIRTQILNNQLESSKKTSSLSKGVSSKMQQVSWFALTWPTNACNKSLQTGTNHHWTGVFCVCFRKHKQ